MQAAIPENQPQRLIALRRYGILDSLPEPAFDDITRIVARVCGTPVALISLVDECRQWFKSATGLDLTETPLEQSFCAYAILQPEMLVVPDTLRDDRFATNPLVTNPPHFRFYAGAPLLTSDGLPLGTLCVLDHTPRTWTNEQSDFLQVLARQVMTLIEHRQSVVTQARAMEERGLAEAALRQERAFLRKVIDTQPSLVFVKDWDGRFVLSNQAVAHCYGSTVDDIVGRTDADLNGKAEEVSHFVRDDREVMSTRRVKIIPEEPVTSADGEVRWFSTVKVPLVNDDGSCNSLLGVATDITAQRRAVAALVDSERLHRTLGDVAPGFIWTVNAEGRFEYANRTWEEFTGSSCDDLNANGWQRFNHPDELAEVERRWSEAAQQGRPFEMELRYRRRDGEFRWMLSRIVPVTDDAGQVSRWVGSSVDIHDLKELEAARRANDDRLKQAQRLEAIGRLAGGVAHDLNNMLVAILGYADFLGQSFSAGDERLRDLQAITKAASQSASLTRQLLAFARRDMIEPRRFDVNALVRANERILQLAVGEGVALEFDLAERTLLTYADMSRIEQVLMNLCLNARDAIVAQGRIRIQSASVYLDESSGARHLGTEVRHGPYVQFSVSDSGHGMNSETLAHIFEPFFTTKSFGQGTGLGLSTAYGTVKQAGGFIWAYSELNRGSVFKVYLPEHVGVADQVPSTESTKPSTSGGVVLVVDDAELVRTTTCRALERYGYTCVAAESGVEALTILGIPTTHVDLVLSDVVMPQLSGLELGRAVERLRPGLPVLYVSGYTEHDLLQRGLLEQGRPFLEKPFTPETVAIKVATLLRPRPATVPKPACDSESDTECAAGP